MRMTRLYKFKRSRHKKARKVLLFAVVVPAVSIIVGYLISSVLILPTIAGK
jgi:hypothetical protein